MDYPATGSKNWVLLVSVLVQCISFIWVWLVFQVEKLNMSLSEEEKKRPIKLEEAETLVHDAFIAAAERQIHVADAINFKVGLICHFH